jgi:hypothetical protein
VNVEVRIGHIVLDGVELRQHERAALPGAVQSELRSLLDRMPAHTARARRGLEPDVPSPRVETIARQIASAVHRGLSAGAAPGLSAGAARPAPARATTSLRAGRPR